MHLDESQAWGISSASNPIRNGYWLKEEKKREEKNSQQTSGKSQDKAKKKPRPLAPGDLHHIQQEGKECSAADTQQAGRQKGHTLLASIQYAFSTAA